MRVKVLAIEASDIDGDIYFKVKVEGNLEDVKEMLNQALIKVDSHLK